MVGERDVAAGVLIGAGLFVWGCVAVWILRSVLLVLPL